MREIRPGHFIFANDRELAEYEEKLQAMVKARQEG